MSERSSTEIGFYSTEIGFYSTQIEIYSTEVMLWKLIAESISSSRAQGDSAPTHTTQFWYTRQVRWLNEKTVGRN